MIKELGHEIIDKYRGRSKINLSDKGTGKHIFPDDKNQVSVLGEDS